MKANYLCLDFEMSGGNPCEHDIIQIGAVLLNSEFEIVNTFETLVYPENEADFDPESKKIHGISRFELEEAPGLEDALDDMECWIEEEGEFNSRQNLRSLKICGQGINNDIAFLKAAYENLNISWPFAYQFIDLQDLFMLYSHVLKANSIEVAKRLSLDSIASYFKLERSGSKHNALEDAELTARCIAQVFLKSAKFKVEL